MESQPNAARREMLGLLAAMILVQLPFAFLMPFHLDDRIFMSITDNIDRQPLMPFMQPAVWEGRLWSDMMSYSHPPLACYYLYLLRAVAGPYPEIAAHLGFLAFYLLLGAAFFHLFRFLGLPARVGTLMALFSPLVFVSSHTIMMDIPALAFGLAGVTASLYGLRDGRASRLLLGGAFIGLAVLVAYSAFFFVVPPLLYALLTRRPFRHLALIGLLPMLFLGGWLGFVYLVTGRFVFGDMVKLLEMYRLRPHSDMASRLVYNLSVTGGTMLFPLSLLGWRLGSIRGKVYLLAMLPLGFWISLQWPEQGLYRQMAMAVCVTAGAILLVEGLIAVFTMARRGEADTRRNGWFLGAWIALFYVLTLLAYPHGAARYQLWLLPPLLAAFLMSFTRTATASTLFYRRVFLLILIGGQVFLAVTCAVADLEMARGYRQVVAAIFQKYKQPDNDIWIAADWGLRHYAVASGGRTILRYDRRPRPGDILIRPVLTASTYETGYEQALFGSLRETLAVRSGFPGRLLHPSARAGFYSDYWGFLPVWLDPANTPLDEIQVIAITGTLPADPRREAEENTGMLRGTGEVEIPR